DAGDDVGRPARRERNDQRDIALRIGGACRPDAQKGHADSQHAPPEEPPDRRESSAHHFDPLRRHEGACNTTALLVRYDRGRATQALPAPRCHPAANCFTRKAVEIRRTTLFQTLLECLWIACSSIVHHRPLGRTAAAVNCGDIGALMPPPP